jgi:hypothetical protein
MLRFQVHCAIAGAAVLLLPACSNGAREADSVRADSVQRAAVAASVADTRHAERRSDAGVGGLWDIVSLEKRLDLQGMVPRRIPEPVHHGFLSVPGIGYHLGNAELQVFIYADAASARADVARLDTLTVSPPTTPVRWQAKPTLITNSNLAAILLTDDALQIERVQRALMAGTGSTVFDPPTR